MFFRLIRSGTTSLKSFLLTSDIITYHSPLFLQSILDKYEYSRDVPCNHRIAIGDRVEFVNIKTNKPFQVIIASSIHNNPKQGFISIYSYLGGALLGLELNNKFNVFVLGELYQFEITKITPEKTINNTIL